MTQPVEWYVSLIQAFIVINLVMATFAYLTLAERKVMGRMQLRYGPNRAGFRGMLQPIADLLKLLNKESFEPTEAINWAFILGPFLAAFTALVTFSVIPFGPGWEVGGVYIPGQVADLDIALILIFASARSACTASSSAAGRPTRSTPCSARCARARSSSRTRSRSRSPCSAS